MAMTGSGPAFRTSGGTSSGGFGGRGRVAEDEKFDKGPNEEDNG